MNFPLLKRVYNDDCLSYICSWKFLLKEQYILNTYGSNKIKKGKVLTKINKY